jgi:hypothetical protein
MLRYCFDGWRKQQNHATITAHRLELPLQPSLILFKYSASHLIALGGSPRDQFTFNYYRPRAMPFPSGCAQTGEDQSAHIRWPFFQQRAIRSLREGPLGSHNEKVER